jgi:hypothetical protein
VPEGLAFSDSEKAETLTDRLEGHFQSVDDPLDLPFIEIIHEARCAYEYAPANEPK